MFLKKEKVNFSLFPKVAVINLWGYKKGAARHKALENVWLCMYNKRKFINTFISPRLYP